jgi:hypothetical protein
MKALLNVDLRIANGARIRICVFVGVKRATALRATELRRPRYVSGGVELLFTNRAERVFALALIVDNRIAAVRALARRYFVCADVYNVSAGAFYFFAREKPGFRFGESTAVRAFDYKFRHCVLTSVFPRNSRSAGAVKYPVATGVFPVLIRD